MSSSPIDTIDELEAFEYWDSTQERLCHAIQEYTHAASILEKVLTRPPRGAASRGSSDAFSKLCTELPHLHLYEFNLREVRLSFSKIHNSSHSRVPINSLPADVLTMIFSLATQEWINQDYQYNVGGKEALSPSVLSGVCVLWRELLLQSPVFWSDLDFVLTGPSKETCYIRAVIWAERAKTAPLHVSVRDASVELGNFEPIMGMRHLNDSDISRVVDFLTPLMPRVHTLVVNSEKHSVSKLTSMLLECWVRYGSTGTAERLEIREDLGLDEVELPVISPESDDTKLSLDVIEAFLISLRSIYIENVAVNWGNPIYSGLTELRIDFSFDSVWFPSQQDIAHLLKANPELKSLALCDIRVDPGPVSASVSLDHLETLCLETMEGSDLALILPLISTTSNAVRVALTLDDDPEFISAARSFFARTRVTVLHVDGELSSGNQSIPQSISALFVPMPYLHTLSIQICDISEAALHDLDHHRASHNNSADYWPVLRKIYLLQCGTTPDIVQQFVRMHAPQTLHLLENRPEIIDKWAADVRAKLQEDLLNAGVDLVWQEDAKRSAFHWTFVST